MSYSMGFNVRLEFVHTNAHDAQLYKDPMNRWVMKIEEHPTAFDPSPWVNYQEEMYVGQEGACYQVTTEPNNVDKLGQLVTIQKIEEPPYEETHELKLFTTIKVTCILVDDQDIALYMRESMESKQSFCTKNPPPHTLVKDKVLYAYMRVTQTMDLTLMFIDKFVVLYEPMDNRAMQDLTFHGTPIPKLGT